MKRSSRIYLFSALSPIIIMCMVWIINQNYPFGDNSLMAVDFGQQFIDFFLYLKTCLLSGDVSGLVYSFQKSLGGNMVGTTAYYLMSSFNLIYVLFPVSMINMANFVIILLRYACMGLAFSHFLIKRHHALDYAWPLTATLATIYALNGYNVSYQMVPIFYDAMILLPLLLIGVEEVLDGGRPYRYIMLLAVTIFLQYYMGYMISLFIVLYSIYYLLIHRRHQPWSEYWSICLDRFVRMFFFSLIGIGLISFFMVPNFMNLMASKGALNTPNIFEWTLQINPVDILSKLMLGAFDNDSWPAGPNLPNLYIGSLGLFGLVSFYLSKRVSRDEKIAATGVLLVFLLSFVNEFTSKIWHLGQNPAGFFYRFSWITVFFFLLLSFKGLRNIYRIRAEDVFLVGGLIFIWVSLVNVETYSFLTEAQIQVSVLLLVGVILLFYFKSRKQRQWFYVFLLTCMELGANAAVSQGRMNYTNALKFQNAIEVMAEAIDPIRPSGDNFYRISKNFNRSKNDPFMLNYPGLTIFSSNLEGSLRDLFTRLGNNDVDATTYYYGTPLTDALFSVRYFVANQPVPLLSDELRRFTYVFGEDVHREDIIKTNQPVIQTERLKVYQGENILPIGFGVSTDFVSLNLNDNLPIENQNDIAQALAGSKKNFFEKFDDLSWELEGLDNVQGNTRIVQLSPGVSEGRARLKFKPDDSGIYYLTLPQEFSTTNNDMRLEFNGKNLPYRAKFTNTQLLTLTSQSQGEEQVLDFIIQRNVPINLSGIKMAKLDETALASVIQDKQKEGFLVEKWGNTFFEGQIFISEDSHWMFTSIPYDAGWQAFVDNQEVMTTKVWDSLLAFEVPQGSHKISLKYLPPGFYLGLGISVVSLCSLLLLTIYDWRQNKPKLVGDDDAKK